MTGIDDRALEIVLQKGTVTLLRDTQANTHNLSIADLFGQTIQNWIAGRCFPRVKSQRARLLLLLRVCVLTAVHDVAQLTTSGGNGYPNRS